MSNIRKSGGIAFEKISSAASEEMDRQKADAEEAALLAKTACAQQTRRHTYQNGQELLAEAEMVARAEVKNAKEQGYLKGSEEGFRQGAEEGARREIEAKRPLFQAIETLYARLSEQYAIPEENKTDAAFELAQTILAIELATNDEAYFGLYRKAALHIGRAEKATLRAGRRGCAVVNENLERFKGAIDGLNSLNVLAAENGDDGYCVLETTVGNVDASAEVQLERARHIISPNG